MQFLIAQKEQAENPAVPIFREAIKKRVGITH